MQTKLSHIYIYTRLYSSHNNYTTDDDNYNNKSKAVKIIKYDTGQNMEQQQQQQKRKKKLKKTGYQKCGLVFYERLYPNVI